MGDGRFTVPIATDDGRVLAWGRGDCEVPNANYHKCIGTQLRYLRLIDGAVTEISQADKDALAAQDALAEQEAAEAEAARAEQQRLDDEQAAIDAASIRAARAQHITGLRAMYITATHAMCDIFGIAHVDVLGAAEIQQRGEALTDTAPMIQAMKLAMVLSNCEQKLCRMDGDDALERVSEVEVEQ